MLPASTSIIPVMRVNVLKLGDSVRICHILSYEMDYELILLISLLLAAVLLLSGSGLS